MNARVWKTVIAGCACAALTTAVIAAQPPATHKSKSQPANRPAVSYAASQTKPQMEKVTLEIRGADSAECARLLSSALAAHHVNAAIQASQTKPYRVTTSIDPKTNLGECGQAVMDSKTPDRAKNPPSLDLVLYGKFDKGAAKTATEALAKIKGVDARNSNVNAATGEVNIRIVGGAKVTADEIQRALQQAGVWAQFTRSNTPRTS